MKTKDTYGFLKYNFPSRMIVDVISITPSKYKLQYRKEFDDYLIDFYSKSDDRYNFSIYAVVGTIYFSLNGNMLVLEDV